MCHLKNVVIKRWSIGGEGRWDEVIDTRIVTSQPHAHYFFAADNCSDLARPGVAANTFLIEP